jgi:hypothetical protein
MAEKALWSLKHVLYATYNRRWRVRKNVVVIHNIYHEQRGRCLTSTIGAVGGNWTRKKCSDLFPPPSTTPQLLIRNLISFSKIRGTHDWSEHVYIKKIWISSKDEGGSRRKRYFSPHFSDAATLNTLVTSKLRSGDGTNGVCDIENHSGSDKNR